MWTLNYLGNEGWAHWKTISKKVDPTKGNEVFKAFCKGMEISDSYWTARKAYLSKVKQGPKETAAELAARVKDMVLQGRWPEDMRHRTDADRSSITRPLLTSKSRDTSRTKLARKAMS